MRQLRIWWRQPWGVMLAAAAILCFLCAVAAAQPAPVTPGKPVTGKTEPQQQVCPPGQVPSKGTCQMTIECPTINPQGKTVCQATMDCPPPKAAPAEKK